MNQKMPYILFLLSAVLIFFDCSYIKPIKFFQYGKAVETYKVNLLEKRLSMKIKGTYVFFGSDFEIYIKIYLTNKERVSSLGFKIENVILSCNGDIVHWNHPQLDSLEFRALDTKYYFSKTYTTKDFQSLTDEDIEYLQENKFPLEISLNNFIFINDTAVIIDTIYATSPELEYYNNWKETKDF